MGRERAFTAWKMTEFSRCQENCRGWPPKRAPWSPTLASDRLGGVFGAEAVRRKLAPGAGPLGGYLHRVFLGPAGPEFAFEGGDGMITGQGRSVAFWRAQVPCQYHVQQHRLSLGRP